MQINYPDSNGVLNPRVNKTQMEHYTMPVRQMRIIVFYLRFSLQIEILWTLWSIEKYLKLLQCFVGNLSRSLFAKVKDFKEMCNTGALNPSLVGFSFFYSVIIYTASASKYILQNQISFF